MATGPVRPPWLGNWGVQLLGIGLSIYNVVQLVRHLVDGDWGSAFLSFAYAVVFAYVASESWKTRQEIAARKAAEGWGPGPPPGGGPPPTPAGGSPPPHRVGPAPTD
jgi:hypothetical protein